MTRPSQALRLLALAGFSSSIPLTSLSPAPSSASLFTRSDTCVAASLTSCSASLPSNFCCPTNYACLALAANTTAICCPGGSTCKRILPIVCDIGLQSPSFNMSAIVKTTLLDYKLPTCGQACCPFGYQCETSADMPVCVMKSDQSVLPDGIVLSSSSSKLTTSSSSASTSSVSTSAARATTTHDTKSEMTSTSLSPRPTSSVSASASAGPIYPSSPFAVLPSPTSIETVSSPTSTATPSSSSSTGKIVGGVIGAISGLVLFAFIFLWIRRKRNPRISINGALASGDPPLMGGRSTSPTYLHSHGHSRNGSKSSGPLSGSQISNPMGILTGGLLRTDFIRKPSGSSSSSSDADDRISPANSPRYETYARRNDHGHGNISQTDGLTISAHHGAVPVAPPAAMTHAPRNYAASHDSLVPAPLQVTPPYSENMPLGHQNYRLDRNTPTIRLVDQKVALRPSMSQMHPGLGVYRSDGMASSSQRDTTMTFMMHEAGVPNVQSGQPYMPYRG
ncbi:hypothetical protein HOO65_030887 [Ceratocystis lukuohia]